MYWTISYNSDGNSWYEVPYLAQDTVFTDMENTLKNDDELYTYSDQFSIFTKTLKTSRRFTTFIREDNRTEIRFGGNQMARWGDYSKSRWGCLFTRKPPTYLNTFDPATFYQ